jgi:NAD(P)-dependent dehydrogenase (short-subunit alcohol dehydrogenase family)
VTARHALVVGNSDGIGLALTRKLLADGWTVTGASRSPSRVEHERYEHAVLDVAAPAYRASLAAALARRSLGGGAALDACVYCAGIGEFFDPEHLDADARTFAVNLLGVAATLEVVLPGMLAARRGHVVGLSSIADDAASAEAPSYAASKAGLTSYLVGLAFALRPRGVSVTNVRLGFVDTKMAKARVRPFMVSPDKAADVLIRCLRTRPVQVTYPKRMGVLVRAVRWVQSLRVWFG